MKLFKKNGNFLILWSFNIGEKEYKGNIIYKTESIKNEQDLLILESHLKRVISEQRKDITIPNSVLIENITKLE